MNRKIQWEHRPLQHPEYRFAFGEFRLLDLIFDDSSEIIDGSLIKLDKQWQASLFSNSDTDCTRLDVATGWSIDVDHS